MTKVWSENNVYFFYTVGHIAKVYFFGPYFNTHNSVTITLNLFIPTSKLIFTKNQKDSTIEALWGTVISP